MGVIVRQSIQNTIISYGGVILGFVSTILLYPRILTPDQYGLTRILISLTAVCTQFAHLGMKNTIIRYFPHFKETRTDKNGLLFLAIVVPFFGFLIFAILFFLFDEQFIFYYSDQSHLIEEYYLYLLPLVFFILYYEVINSYVRALQDSVTGSFLNEIVMRLLIIALLVAYSFGLFDFTLFMILFVLVYGVEPVVLLIYLFIRGEFSLKIPFRGTSKKLAKGMAVYGGYTMLGGLTSILVGNIDIIMLGAMSNLATAAVYAIAFYVGSVIEIPKRSIAKIATPILSDLMKKKNFAKVDTLYSRTSLNQIIAGSLLLVGIWANMHNLLDLLPEEYQGAEWVIIIVGFAKLIDMATGINGQIILNSKYYRFDFYTVILLVVLTATTNYLLIPIYGIVGAAVATSFSILIYNLVKYIFVWKKFSMQPFCWSSLGVLVIGAGCLLLSFQIPYLINFVVDVTIRSLAIFTMFLGLVLIFNLSEDVKQLVLESLRRLRTLLT